MDDINVAFGSLETIAADRGVLCFMRKSLAFSGSQFGNAVFLFWFRVFGTGLFGLRSRVFETKFSLRFRVFGSEFSVFRVCLFGRAPRTPLLRP